MAARLASVMALLVLNSFADLYYARFRPELRDYVSSTSSRGSAAALKHKTNRPATTTNEIELKERERRTGTESTRGASATLLEAAPAAAEGGGGDGTTSASSESAPRATASVFTFAGSSKHKRMSPEVFASFLSRSIYFWPWRYPRNHYLRLNS